MTDLLQITIDLTKAGLGLAADELEARLITLADELRLGKLAESARLARQEELPEGAKSGMLAFMGGVVIAVVTRKNLMKSVDFLGNQFYGKTLTVTCKASDADGASREYSFEHNNAKDIERALAAIERLERMEKVSISVKEIPPNFAL
jgi:hypothetical protein